MKGGELEAAAQEARFTRKKHDEGFPVNAVNYCLDHVGGGAENLDYVAFYEKPLLKFDRLLDTYFAYAPNPHATTHDKDTRRTPWHQAIL